MNRFFFLSTALFIATGIAGAATISRHAYAGSGASCEHYAGHASVEGKWGSERSITETSAFVPLACREDRLLYGDVRLKGDNRGNREGNVGIGVRALKENGVAGGYVYLDRRRSGATEKLFTQTTLGAEWLAEDWEVRGNAYVPLSGKKQMGTSGGEALSDPYLAGSGIYVDVAGQNAIVEKPLWGADAEAGLKLPGKDFWLHAGAFAFDASEAEGLAGGRLRATYKVTDNIALTAEGQYDNVRGRQGWLGVRFTVPFGGPKTKHEGLKARMMADPVRDVDIVTAAVEEQISGDHTAPVENITTGVAQRVLHVDNSAGGGGDGTLENPFNTLAAAQAAMQDNDVIYINRGTGTSAGMNAGLSVARNNVWVIGSGTDFVYDAGRFRAPTESNLSGTVMVAGGAAPVITNVGVNGDGINVTGANNFIGGVTVNGAARHGIYALSSAGTDLGNITVRDVTVTANTQNGVLIETGAGSSFGAVSVSDASISGNAGRGLYALVQAGGDVDNITLSDITSTNNTGANGRGVEIGISTAGSTIGTVTVEDSTFTGNAAQGLYVVGSSSGLISTININDIIASTNANAGVQVGIASGADIGTLNVDGITASNNTTAAGRGFYLDINGAGSTVTTVTLNDITTASNGANGTYVNVQTDGLLTTLNASDISSNLDDSRGIYFLAQLGGDIGTILADGMTATNIAGAAGRGMEIIASGAGSTINSATIENSTFNNNLNMGLLYQAISSGVITTSVVRNTTAANNTGLGIEMLAQVAGSMGTVTLGNVTTTGNAGRGVIILAQTDGDIATATVDNLTSQNNTGASGRGLEVTATGAGSSIGGITLGDSVFTGNAAIGVHINTASTATITTIGVSGVTASSNASQGLLVQSTADGDIGTITIEDTTAQNNTGANGVGVQVLATGAGSTITSAILDNITASGNANYGIYGAGSTNGVISNIEISNSHATAGSSYGISLEGISNGVITSATVRDSVASGNAGVGLAARGLTGGDIGTFIARNMTVVNNTSRGIAATAEAANSILSSVTIEDSVVQDNDTDGGVYVSASNTGLITSATISDVQVTNNVNRGVYAVVLSGGDIGTLTIDNVTSTNNTAVNGRGIQIQASDAGSTITTATVTNSTVSGNANNGLYGVTLSSGIISSLSVSNTVSTGNGGNGIAVDSQTGGQTYATLNDVVASGNSFTGLYIVSSGNSILNASILNSTSTGNVSNGVYADDDTTGAYILDLGGGALGGTGNNRIFGNTSTELRVDLDGGQLKAENNWWGVGTGLAGGEITLEVGSTVDSAPFLAADPGP